MSGCWFCRLTSSTRRAGAWLQKQPEKRSARLSIRSRRAGPVADISLHQVLRTDCYSHDDRYGAVFFVAPFQACRTCCYIHAGLEIYGIKIPSYNTVQRPSNEAKRQTKGIEQRLDFKLGSGTVFSNYSRGIHVALSHCPLGAHSPATLFSFSFSPPPPPPPCPLTRPPVLAPPTLTTRRPPLSVLHYLSALFSGIQKESNGSYMMKADQLI